MDWGLRALYGDGKATVILDRTNHPNEERAGRGIGKNNKYAVPSGVGLG